MNSLFRSQVLQHQTRLLGEISLAQPLSIYLLSGGLAVLLFLLSAFLLSAEHHRKESVQGYLVPSSGMLNVIAKQGGTIEEIFVKEGDEINIGDPLVSIANPRDALNSADLEQTLLDQLDARIQLLDESIVASEQLFEYEHLSNQVLQRELKDKLDNLDAQAQLTSSRLLLHENRIQARRKLAAVGHLSGSELDRSEEQFLNQQQDVIALQNQMISLRQDHRIAIDQSAQIPLKFSLAKKQLNRTRSELLQQYEEMRASFHALVRATKAGTITSVQISVGQNVVVNDPLLSVLPAGASLMADLYLPTRSAGMVQLGHKTRLRFDAFPYQKFGLIDAEVVQIDQSLLMPGRNQLLSSNEPVYRIRAFLTQQNLHLNDQAFALKAGMQVEADILLEKRQLLDWVLEPIYGFKARVG